MGRAPSPQDRGIGIRSADYTFLDANYGSLDYSLFRAGETYIVDIGFPVMSERFRSAESLTLSIRIQPIEGYRVVYEGPEDYLLVEGRTYELARGIGEWKEWSWTLDNHCWPFPPSSAPPPAAPVGFPLAMLWRPDWASPPPTTATATTTATTEATTATTAAVPPEERAGDALVTRRSSFKPVPERLPWVQLPRYRNAAERRADWCVGSFPELTMVVVGSGGGAEVRPCWDAVRGQPILSGAYMSTERRTYTVADGLMFGRPLWFEVLGSNWTHYGAWSVPRPTLGYVNRHWVVVRNFYGEVSRTVRLDIYSDRTYGFAECDHLVLC